MKAACLTFHVFASMMVAAPSPALGGGPQFRGRIVRVSASAVVINRGRLHGVRRGMTGKVLVRVRFGARSRTLAVARFRVERVASRRCRARVLGRTAAPRRGHLVSWDNRLRPAARTGRSSLPPVARVQLATAREFAKQRMWRHAVTHYERFVSKHGRLPGSAAAELARAYAKLKAWTRLARMVRRRILPEGCVDPLVQHYLLEGRLDVLKLLLRKGRIERHREDIAAAFLMKGRHAEPVAWIRSRELRSKAVLRLAKSLKREGRPRVAARLLDAALALRPPPNGIRSIIALRAKMTVALVRARRQAGPAPGARRTTAGRQSAARSPSPRPRRTALPRALSRSQVVSVVVARRPGLSSCYFLHGSAIKRIWISWLIRPDGRVGAVRLTPFAAANSRFGRCLILSVRSWRFPGFNGPEMEVRNYPISFD